MLVRRYGMRPDTGGPGKFRGGCGVYRDYELETPARLYLWFERSVTPAWGLFGGGQAVGPDVTINPGRPDERHLLKANGVELSAGDVVRVETGGGGGYGAAVERDPGRVQEDVIDGYVTRDGAERQYGVVLGPDPSVNREASRPRRDQMKG